MSHTLEESEKKREGGAGGRNAAAGIKLAPNEVESAKRWRKGES